MKTKIFMMSVLVMIPFIFNNKSHSLIQNQDSAKASQIEIINHSKYYNKTFRLIVKNDIDSMVFRSYNLFPADTNYKRYAALGDFKMSAMSEKRDTSLFFKAKKYSKIFYRDTLNVIVTASVIAIYNGCHFNHKWTDTIKIDYSKVDNFDIIMNYELIPLILSAKHCEIDYEDYLDVNWDCYYYLDY